MGWVWKPSGVLFLKPRVASERLLVSIQRIIRQRLRGKSRGSIRQILSMRSLNLREWRVITQFALAAAYMAFTESGLQRSDVRGGRPLLFALGTSTSAFDVIDDAYSQMGRHGARRITPRVITASPPHAIAGALTSSLGIPTDTITVSNGCAAGMTAVSLAVEAIKSGRSDIAMAGGADAPITPLIMASASSAGLASKRNDIPRVASRPFDRERDSGVISEGAALLVLENYEHALSRGARIYFELVGFGNTVDLPGEEPGCGLKDSMVSAMANAGKRADEIDYICAHGPGHPVMDRVETQMIKAVFGKRAYSIPISSIKGVTGNPFSACGPMQLVACAKALEEGLVPPTANFRCGDGVCDLNFIPDDPRMLNLRVLLVNVHGIGGSNISVVVEKATHG